jgi:hypothetical protein
MREPIYTNIDLLLDDIDLIEQKIVKRGRKLGLVAIMFDEMGRRRIGQINVLPDTKKLLPKTQLPPPPTLNRMQRIIQNTKQMEPPPGGFMINFGREPTITDS